MRWETSRPDRGTVSSIRRALRPAGLIALAALVVAAPPSPRLFAQTVPTSQTVATSAKRLAFDVASVKPHQSDDQQIMMVAQPGGRFTATNIPLRLLIGTAYQLQDDQITGGPSWITSERFDVLAKSDIAGAPSIELLAMLQTLLADRFGLTAHRDMKELPIYAVVMTRSDRTLGAGLRLTMCPDPAIDLSRPQPCAKVSNGSGQLTLRGTPFSQFLPYLAPYVNRVVVDRTGLNERYDIDLKWMPGSGRGAAAPDAPPVDEGPSIFTAMQEQLGLKLEATRGPVEVLVIDTADHPAPD